MKIPTGYYERPASLGKYLKKEFARNLPIKDRAELSACQIHSLYDNVTQKISLSKKGFVDFRMNTLKEPFNAHSGAGCTTWDNKMFITGPNCFGGAKGISSQIHDNVYLLRRSKISNHC